MKYRSLSLLTLFLAAQSPAAENAWDWDVTPYLWGAGINGGVSVGSIDSDISVDFSDIVNILQGAVLLRLEATSGQNGVFGDLAYLALEEDEAKDTLAGTLEAELDSLIVEAGYRRFRSCAGSGNGFSSRAIQRQPAYNRFLGSRYRLWGQVRCGSDRSEFVLCGSDCWLYI